MVEQVVEQRRTVPLSPTLHFDTNSPRQLSHPIIIIIGAK